MTISDQDFAGLVRSVEHLGKQVAGLGERFDRLAEWVKANSSPTDSGAGRSGQDYVALQDRVKRDGYPDRSVDAEFAPVKVEVVAGDESVLPRCVSAEQAGLIRERVLHRRAALGVRPDGDAA